MPLLLLRIFFVMVAAGIGAQFIGHPQLVIAYPSAPWIAFGGSILLACTVITIDFFTPQKRLEVITSIYFGITIGLFLTYVFTLALAPITTDPDSLTSQISPLLLGMVLCYTCVSVLLQTNDDFRFIIPYVEFSKDVKGLKPYILDTSVVIDGRIADVVETNIIDSPLIMPQFAIAELQGISDSSDRTRRSRGRRGLDILNKMRKDPTIDLQIYDIELPEFQGKPVDQKLVLLAKHLGGKVVTNDYNLNKVAKLYDVGVINLNDIANALKPVFLPGENFNVRIIKQGEEAGQGVGYLDDGTMVVIEGGRDHVQHLANVNVTSVLQTSAGRMVFGKFEGSVEGPDGQPPSETKPSETK